MSSNTVLSEEKNAPAMNAVAMNSNHYRMANRPNAVAMNSKGYPKANRPNADAMNSNGYPKANRPNAVAINSNRYPKANRPNAVAMNSNGYPKANTYPIVSAPNMPSVYGPLNSRNTILANMNSYSEKYGVPKKTFRIPRNRGKSTLKNLLEYYNRLGKNRETNFSGVNLGRKYTLYRNNNGNLAMKNNFPPMMISASSRKTRKNRKNTRN